MSSAAQSQSTSFDWDGWFFGGQVGLTGHTATYEDRDYDWYSHSQDFESVSGSLGVQLGYNIVDNSQLTGFVADLSFLGNSTETIYSSDVIVANDVNYLATLRGRAGLAVENTMVYVTGGLAFAGFDRSWTEFNDVDDTWPDLGADKLGVVLGFGVERAINNRWSISGEYTASVFGDNTSFNDDDFPLEINDTVHQVTLAFNYNIGDTENRTVAAYGTPADFSGAYFGGFLGYGGSTIAQSDIDYDYYGGSYDVGQDGGVLGLNGGYNWQSGATVVGVDIQFGSSNIGTDFEPDFGPVSTSIDSFASIRGRAGMAAGNTLLYVLGGITVADITNNYVNLEDLSGTYTGLTVGAGVEKFITDNLSWVAEGTYTMLDGDDDANGNYFHGSADAVMLTAGLNYHLGGTETGGTGALRPTHDWAGNYYGVDVALMANRGTVTDVDYNEFGGSFDVTSLGAGLGGHYGYNWQNGSFVYGAVADIAFFSNDEARTSLGYREVRSSIDAMATVRGRMGIASGDTLFYATGGLALIESTLTHEYDGGTNSYDLSDTRIAPVVGLGMEHAVTENSSFRVEALLTSSGEASYFNGDDCSSGVPGFDGFECDMIGSDTNITIKAGYSWSF